jgi:hypothetical protein
VAQALEDGFTFLCLGSDLIFLDAGARRSIQWARAALSSARSSGNTRWSPAVLPRAAQALNTARFAASTAG